MALKNTSQGQLRLFIKRVAIGPMYGPIEKMLEAVVGSMPLILKTSFSSTFPHSLISCCTCVCTCCHHPRDVKHQMPRKSAANR